MPLFTHVVFFCLSLWRSSPLRLHARAMTGVFLCGRFCRHYVSLPIAVDVFVFASVPFDSASSVPTTPLVGSFLCRSVPARSDCRLLIPDSSTLSANCLCPRLSPCPRILVSLAAPRVDVLPWCRSTAMSVRRSTLSARDYCLGNRGVSVSLTSPRRVISRNLARIIAAPPPLQDGLTPL